MASRKSSGLKDFANQYRFIRFGGYKYIECPAPPLQFLLACRWLPAEEDKIVELQTGIMEQRTTLIEEQLGVFYHRGDRCYYIIDHLWLASLASWCPMDMSLYLRKTFATMLLNSHKVEEPVPEKVEAPNLFKPITEEEMKKALVVAKVNPLLESITKAVEKEIALDKEIAEKLSYYEIYGVPAQVFFAMQSDYISVNGKRHTKVEDHHVHILDLCKILYLYNKLPMKDIYELLKSHGVITQSDDKTIGKYHIYLLKKDWGYTESKDSTDYPVFNRKGVLNISMMLVDSDMIDKHILLV